MSDAGMEKLEAQQLPDKSAPQSLGAQLQVFLNGKTQIDIVDLLESKRDNRDNQQGNGKWPARLIGRTPHIWAVTQSHVAKKVVVLDPIFNSLLPGYTKKCA